MPCPSRHRPGGRPLPASELTPPRVPLSHSPCHLLRSGKPRKAFRLLPIRMRAGNYGYTPPQMRTSPGGAGEIRKPVSRKATPPLGANVTTAARSSVATAGPSQSVAAGPVAPTADAACRLRPVPLGAATITGGLWEARRQVNGDVAVPLGR